MACERCRRQGCHAHSHKSLHESGSRTRSRRARRAQYAARTHARERRGGEQVEVKLRLADKAAHDKVVDLLQASQTHLYEQRNTFFDGANKELSSQRTVLRVRWFNGEEKVVITVKGKMAVTDGIGRAQEDEDEVDVATARGFDDDPSAILAVDLPVIQALKSCAPCSQTRSHGCCLACGWAFIRDCSNCYKAWVQSDLQPYCALTEQQADAPVHRCAVGACRRVSVDKLVALGGFTNIRKVVPWRGETLEIDETRYEWGTVFEIECETADPEGVREKLGAFLDENGVAYKYNTSTKFQNFINRTLE